MAGRETNKSYYKKFRDLDRDSIVLSHIDNEELANRVKSDFRYEAIKNKIEEGRPKLSQEATRQQELRQAIDDYNAKNKNKPTQYIGMPSDNVIYQMPWETKEDFLKKNNEITDIPRNKDLIKEFVQEIPMSTFPPLLARKYAKKLFSDKYNRDNRVGNKEDYEKMFSLAKDRDEHIKSALLDPKNPINYTKRDFDKLLEQGEDIYDFYDSDRRKAHNILDQAYNITGDSFGITDKSYDFMTMNDEEKAIYNYYYSKYGEKIADKYRKSISNELRYRASLKIQEKNASKSAIEKGANGLLTAFETGLDRGTTNLVFGVPKAILGIDTKSEPSIEEHNFARIRENSQGAYKTALDVTNSVGNAIPSIALDVAGTTVGMPLLGSVASGAGGAYQGAIDEGYSVDQATVYGAIQGVSPLVVNKLVGELGKIGGSTAEKFLNNKEAFSEAVKGITSAIESPVGKKLLKDAIEEAGSESEAVISGYLGYYINNALRNIIFEEDNDLNPISEEAWNDAIIGAMSEGVLKAPGAFVDAARTYNTGKNSNIEDYSGIAQRLDINENNYTDDGLFNVVKDTKDIAEFLSNKKSNGKKIGNFEKGMLENNLNTILTESEQYYRPYTETEVIPSEENLNGNSENIILPTPIDRRAKQFPANGENAYNAAYRDNLPIDIYDEGFKAAYNAGRFNQPLDEITHPSYHMLSDDQKNLAYEAGKADSRAIRENRNRNR